MSNTKNTNDIIAAIGRQFIDAIESTKKAYAEACRRKFLAEWTLKTFGAPEEKDLVRRMAFSLLNLDWGIITVLEAFLKTKSEERTKREAQPNPEQTGSEPPEKAKSIFESHQVGLQVILVSFFIGSTAPELNIMFSELFKITTDRKEWVLNLLVHTYIFPSRREWIEKVIKGVFRSQNASYDALLAGIIRTCHRFPGASMIFQAMLRGGMSDSAIALAEAFPVTPKQGDTMAEFDPAPTTVVISDDFDFFSGDTVEIVMPPEGDEE